MLNTVHWNPCLLVGVLAAVGMLMAVACGAAEEATPTPAPTATPTAAVATPTPTTTIPPTPKPTTGVQPKYGGIIKQWNTDDPPTFDPHNATSNNHNQHNSKMNVNLIWLPAGGPENIVPHAAESYSISSDGTVWTFKLRDNVRYQTYTSGSFAEVSGPRDGTLMTAADVKYSLEKIMGLVDGFASARSGWMKEFVDIARPDHGVVAVDDRTVELHLTQPFAGLSSILILGFSAIIPEGTTREMLQSRTYGAGPFKMKEFERGSLYVYERNPDYFNPDRPYLDEYHIVLMKDAGVAQSAFLTRKVDSHNGNPTPDNKQLFADLLAEGKIEMLDYNVYNASSGCSPQGAYMNSFKPPFDNKRLRDAVNLAIDREGYTQVVHFGYGVPSLLLDPGGGYARTAEEIMQMPGHRQPRDQDLAEAKRIVNELYPNGLDLTLMGRDSSAYPRQAEYIAGELRKININTNVQLLDSARVYEEAGAGTYTIWAYYFCQTTLTPEELFGSYFLTGGSRNWTGGWSNPELDTGYLDLAATMDMAERKRKAQALEDMVLEDMIVAPLPVHTSTWNNWWYVKDWPVTTSFYNNRKCENVWRSDV